MEIATFSIEAVARPIGTVTLAQVVFDVLATPGTVARYTMTPREVRSQSEAPYTRIGGATGEVVVVSKTSAGTQTAAQLATAAKRAVTPSAVLAPPIVTDRVSRERAAAVRPRGGVVDLVVPVQHGTHVTPQLVRVQPDPARASE